MGIKEFSHNFHHTPFKYRQTTTTTDLLFQTKKGDLKSYPSILYIEVDHINNPYQKVINKKSQKKKTKKKKKSIHFLPQHRVLTD